MTPVANTPDLDALAPFAPVRDDLAAVERRLLEGGASSARAITDIGRHLQQSGGKRIRAALVLLAARLAGCPEAPRVTLAAIAEMIHAATLIHDDILDEADTRRGRPSTNVLWGNARCVLAGDWLYMQAFRLALELRHFGILDALISLTQDMVEGEMLQLDLQGRLVSAAEHMELIERKTARLFQVSSQLGAMAANRPQAEIAALGRYGRHLGLAFQMVDDLLDFTGSQAALGKPVGNDLREGKMTLPAIYAAEREGTSVFEAVLRDRAYGEGGPAAVLAAVERSGALDRARREAQEQSNLAAAALADFPDSPWRAALLALPRLVVERDR